MQFAGNFNLFSKRDRTSADVVNFDLMLLM